MFKRHDLQTEAYGTLLRSKSSHFHYAKRFRTFTWSNSSDAGEWRKGGKRMRLIMIYVFIQGTYSSFFVVVSYRQLVKWEMMPEIKRAKIWIYQLFFPSWHFLLTALPFSRLLLLEESKMSGKATSAPWLPPHKRSNQQKAFLFNGSFN